MDDTKLREEAERRVAARRALLGHAFSYVVVIGFLFSLDWWTDRVVDWAFWPAAGWGFGLLAHTFATVAVIGGDHERAVEREMERLRRR